MKVYLIVNPNAGRKAGAAAAESFAAQLREHDLTVMSRLSRWPGHTVDLAEEATREIIAEGAVAEAGAERSVLVAVGGDGTLFEVINGLARAFEEELDLPHTIIPVTVAQLPVGTGNSFIKDIGIASPEELLAAILAGTTRRVDAGLLSCEAGRFHFVNLLGAGFVSAVAHRAASYKRLGALSYVIGVLQETIALAPQPITVTVDGTTYHRDGVFVEICNSRYTGGDMMMAPTARIDDGFFDVVVMSRVTRRKLLSLFPKIFSGTHVEDPVIEVFRGANIAVETTLPWLLTPDGETFGTTPLTATICPGLLQMIAPAAEG